MDNSRTNYTQMLPYMSLDTNKHENVYNNMGNIFGGVFEWIANQVSSPEYCEHRKRFTESLDKIRAVLPEEYQNLTLHADSLPGNVHTIAYPFLSVVVNLNTATLGHRDRKDKGLCMVMVIGDFEDGELCLYEPGLVVPLRSGDLIVFPSASITHYNTHYSGCRASIVLHTDCEIDKWTHGQRNGWEDNMYFH